MLSHKQNFEKERMKTTGVGQYDNCAYKILQEDIKRKNTDIRILEDRFTYQESVIKTKDQKIEQLEEEIVSKTVLEEKVKYLEDSLEAKTKQVQEVSLKFARKVGLQDQIAILEKGLSVRDQKIDDLTYEVGEKESKLKAAEFEKKVELENDQCLQLRVSKLSDELECSVLELKRKENELLIKNDEIYKLNS